jgi:hypothetical protein
MPLKKLPKALEEVAQELNINNCGSFFGIGGSLTSHNFVCIFLGSRLSSELVSFLWGTSTGTPVY